MSDWRDWAACVGEDPELFFPVGVRGPAIRQMRRAKRVCAQCPVRAECLNDALDGGLDHGVFGGASERERRGLSRAQPAHRSPAREHEVEQVLALCDGGPLV